MSTDEMVDFAMELAKPPEYKPAGRILLEGKIQSGQWKGRTIMIDLAFYSEKELGQAIYWAKSKGLSPREREHRQRDHRGGTIDNSSPVAAPICPQHLKEMKLSKSGDSYFCPTKVGTGWCPHKVKIETSYNNDDVKDW